MSLPNDDNETLDALTPGTNASTASNADIPLPPPTPPSSVDIPIDPQLLHADFFPARKPDGSLVAEEVYKTHL